MSISVLSVVGARPQFVKAAMVSRAFKHLSIEETLVHTGQHYDENMSKVFFDEMGIGRPDINLGIGSGGHAYQTGEAMIRIEEVCIDHRPDVVLVYGDTNATLAGALVASKLGVPVAHVEAGLRSFDRSMPEEVNRVVVDHLSSLLFCPTETSVSNLEGEGLIENVHLVGDVMYDATLHFGEMARENSDVLALLSLEDAGYVLATIHRDFNTDNVTRLRGIVEGFIGLDMIVVLPAHPRLVKQLDVLGLMSAVDSAGNLKLIDPVGYIDMLRLEQGARLIITDSGGVQKEAYFNATPCVTVRPSTEWVELVDAGWNILVDAEPAAMGDAVSSMMGSEGRIIASYGEGDASSLVADIVACTRG